MEINDRAVNQIAGYLKVEPTSIKEALTSDKKDVAIETSVKHFFTEEDHSTLVDNLGKRKYGEGNLAGQEMLFKEVKKSFAENEDVFFAPAFEGAKSFTDVFGKLQDIHSNSLEARIVETKKSYEGNIDERLSAANEKMEQLQSKYNTDVEALRGTVDNTKSQIELLEKSHGEALLNERTNNVLAKEISNIMFDVPKDAELKGEKVVKDFISTNRDTLELLVRKNYDVYFDENKRPVFRDKATEKDLLNEKQEPLSAAQIVHMVAESSYMPISKQTAHGRNDFDSNLSGKYSQVNDDNDFAKYAESKGIAYGSNDYFKLRNEWQNSKK